MTKSVQATNNTFAPIMLICWADIHLSLLKFLSEGREQEALVNQFCLWYNCNDTDFYSVPAIACCMIFAEGCFHSQFLHL